MNTTMPLMRPAHDHYGLKTAQEVTNSLSARAHKALKAGLSLRRPVPNGAHDPLSQMLVVETLLNVIPDQEFLTSAFIQRLRLTHGHVMWDSVTVGRILGDLAESLLDVTTPTGTPLRRRRLREGNVYTVVQTVTGWPILLTLRRELQKMAEIEIEQMRRGNRPDHLTSPLEECPVLRMVDEGEAL